MKPLFCINCGQQHQDHHIFCAYCGYHLQANAAPLARSTELQQSTIFEPNTDDLNAYDKHASFLRYTQFFSYFVAAAMLYLGAILPSLLGMIGLHIFAIIDDLYSFGAMIILIIMGAHRRLAKYILGGTYQHKLLTLKAFYLDLPSAKNRFNKPCCIFCGHHTFYKKGVYQTENDRLVYCTKCDSYLYDETDIPWYRVWE
ncbi:zinc-ribbon domain-containing protein [Acinetobacter indicus]|uniref:zinc-ribbon domain-containing protein n=1 Tax=Acinetobacter indicus TaxID=756892 RepID=UPI000CEC9830|nr:zinc-ribbon domain-containing protein [Acinetobacter indicus]